LLLVIDASLTRISRMRLTNLAVGSLEGRRSPLSIARLESGPVAAISAS